MTKQEMIGNEPETENDDRITMILDDGSEKEFTIIESTNQGGVDYILVTDAPDYETDGECYVLKDISDGGSEESIFESVEDDEELDAVFAVFETLLRGEMDIER